MKQGFIKIDRQILEWRYHDCYYAFTIWMHILLLANWTDGYFKGNPIKRGELVTSINNLMLVTGIKSDNTVRKWLKVFESEDMISLKSTNKYTHINIVNYDKFQDAGETLAELNAQQTAYQSAYQSAQRSADNIRIIRNIRSKEDINTTCPEQTSFASEPVMDLPPLILKDGSRFHISQNHFNEFVNAYPGVDVRDQIMKMSQWLKTNQTKRKTKNGIMRFINSWIARSERETINASQSSTKISMPDYIRQQEDGTLSEGTPASKELVERLQKLQQEGLTCQK
nr:MAG TPA: replisome organizer protein [Caudoviricetes sp.]